MIEKVFYVNRQGFTTIVCPACGMAKPLDTNKLPEGKKSLRVKCKCGQLFLAKIEFRKQYRKKTELAGKYIAHNKDDSGRIIVEDISMGGMMLRTLRPHDLHEGDSIDVTVTLDTTPPREITRQLKILRIHDRSIGCRYLFPTDRDPDIGLYLMA